MAKNLRVIDPKPQMVASPNDFGTEQQFTVVIRQNQWLGFGGFTYKTAGTVQSPKTR